MITDIKNFYDEDGNFIIDAVILDKLIMRHEQLKPRFERNMRYYLGEHDGIKARKKTNENFANNKLVCNHAKYIVDIAHAYFIGNEIKYAASEEYDISELDNAYNAQDIANVDSEVTACMGIYGRGYELIYADEEANPRSVCLPPSEAFVVYDDTCEHDPIFGAHYYRSFNIDGVCVGCKCTVYTSDMIYEFSGDTEGWSGMRLNYYAPHYFGIVPLIEHENNKEKQGDFEQLIPLIDAYDLLQSDRVNDKQDFVDAILFLAGINLYEDEAQKLKEERILIGDSDSKAQYLSKIMSESDIKILRDDIKEDIHRFSMVPDLSDESFGGNLSGVAIKYKLLGFEQMIKNKERSFKNSLKLRFEAYNSFLAAKGKMAVVPIHRVDIIFTRNLPANDLENAQMIDYLSGKVSNETLLSQLKFVSDPKEENELLEKEQDERAARSAVELDYFARGGGYAQNE